MTQDKDIVFLIDIQTDIELISGPVLKPILKRYHQILFKLICEKIPDESVDIISCLFTFSHFRLREPFQIKN
jgi:hypothetical protein